MPSRALLLVDIQYEFLPGGALAVSGGEEILPTAYRLLESSAFSLVVASQDYHPRSHISFASRHALSPFTKLSLPNGSTQDLWPDHCVAGTRGCELEQGVATRLGKLGSRGTVVRKGTERETDAYSAFEGAAGEGGLAGVLRETGIEEVYVVGLATDYCVRATVFDALKTAQGRWRVFVVREGVRGVDSSREEEMLEELGKAGARIVSVEAEEVRGLLL